MCMARLVVVAVAVAMVVAAGEAAAIDIYEMFALNFFSEEFSIISTPIDIIFQL